jgi:hypothetical protein
MSVTIVHEDIWEGEIRRGVRRSLEVKGREGKRAWRRKSEKRWKG